MDIGGVQLGRQGLGLRGWPLTPKVDGQYLMAKRNVPNVHIQLPISKLRFPLASSVCLHHIERPTLPRRKVPHMPLSFVLVMFVLPAAIIVIAAVLARATREREG